MEFVVAASDRVLRDAVREKMVAVDVKWIGYIEEGKSDGSIALDVDAEEVALRMASWAWSGHVALLVGRQATWYPKLPMRVAERISSGHIGYGVVLAFSLIFKTIFHKPPVRWRSA